MHHHQQWGQLDMCLRCTRPGHSIPYTEENWIWSTRSSRNSLFTRQLEFVLHKSVWICTYTYVVQVQWDKIVIATVRRRLTYSELLKSNNLLSNKHFLYKMWRYNKTWLNLNINLLDFFSWLRHFQQILAFPFLPSNMYYISRHGHFACTYL